MKPAICTQCGGIIEVDESRDAGICSFCGTAFVTEKVISNYITNHNTININYGDKKDGSREFSQALTQLKLGNFDAAITAIEKATEIAPENPKYWIYDFYIETYRFTRISTYWSSYGGYDRSKPLSARMESVANFYALAGEEDIKACSAELGIDLSSFNRFAVEYLSRLAKAERTKGATIQDSLAMFATDLLSEAKGEEKELVAKAIIELVCSFGTLFGEIDFYKKHNAKILELLTAVKEYADDGDIDRISDRINPITYGNRLNVFSAEFCRGYKNGVLTPEADVEGVSLHIQGSGDFALYLTPSVKSLYVPPNRKITRIEYSPECTPDVLSWTYDKTEVHIIPAEWQSITLRVNSWKGPVPRDYVIYLKGNTEVKAAIIKNTWSTPEVIHPVIVRDGKFGKFYHSKYRDCNTREYAERIMQYHFPEEYESGALSFELTKKQGCYVATAVYGSYDCSEVWTLRRYRDNELAKSRTGRAFIRFYYAVSPTLVKLFGKTRWFNRLFKSRLDKMVNKLRARGFEDTPYDDKKW